MTTAKQRAWRAKFAAMYGKGKLSKVKSHSSRGLRTMARHKRRGSRKGFLGGGIMSLAAPIIAGYLGSSISPSLPVVNTLPYSNVIAGGIAGYLVGKKKGAMIGAATAFLAPQLMGAVSSGTSNEAW
jgi:hypothetical protein